MARPLIKKDQKGVLYGRPPSVEAKIDAVLGRNDWAALAQRARITNPKAPELLTVGMPGSPDQGTLFTLVTNASPPCSCRPCCCAARRSCSRRYRTAPCATRRLHHPATHGGSFSAGTS